MRSKIDPAHAINYLLSGKAHITVHNTQPKKAYIYQFMYSVREKLDKVTRQPTGLWYVYTGKDEYIGFISRRQYVQNTSFRAQKLYKQANDVFEWVWNRLVKQTLPDNIELFHSGQCGHCGRSLRDALSIKTGIGPECRKKLGINVKLGELEREDFAHLNAAL